MSRHPNRPTRAAAATPVAAERAGATPHRIAVSYPAALIAQPGQTSCRKPLAPDTDRVGPHPKLARHLIVPLAIKASENDLGTLDQAGLLSTATGKAHQFRSLLGRTRQRHRDPGHTTPQLVCRPEVSYKISHFNAIKH